MDTTTLRVSEPRELLSLVPHRLGFHPAESVVAVALAPPRGRVGLVVRVDLADLADRGEGPALARGLVAHLGRDGAERAVLVVYTEHDPRPGPDEEVAAAIAHFREAACAPLGDVPAWAVTATGYLSLDCADDCCPPGGRPLAELASTQVNAHMVVAGSNVVACRADVARIVPATGDARRSVARVRRRWALRAARAEVEGPERVERWRADGVAAWRRAVTERAGGAGCPTAAVLGRLEAGLADVRVRDAVLVALVPGTEDLAERCVAGAWPSPRDDAGMARALALVVDPLVGVPPPAVTDVHEAVLEAVVAHGQRGHQAPALTLLGLLAWWRGDGARAQVLLERALDDDDAYRLALLLGDALAHGVPPGWARADR